MDFGVHVFLSNEAKQIFTFEGSAMVTWNSKTWQQINKAFTCLFICLDVRAMLASE
jgi:hypothetical protein